MLLQPLVCHLRHTSFSDCLIGRNRNDVSGLTYLQGYISGQPGYCCGLCYLSVARGCFSEQRKFSSMPKKYAAVSLSANRLYRFNILRSICRKCAASLCPVDLVDRPRPNARPSDCGQLLTCPARSAPSQSSPSSRAETLRLHKRSATAENATTDRATMGS